MVTGKCAWSALESGGTRQRRGGGTTSVSPAVALSKTADVSYVQTESEDWDSSERITNFEFMYTRGHGAP